MINDNTKATYDNVRSDVHAVHKIQIQNYSAMLVSKIATTF